MSRLVDRIKDVKSQVSHNRRSIRLPHYDYAQPGAYFVTIVTKGRLSVFGEIVDHEMRLSPAGEMIVRVWRTMTERFPVVDLGTSIVMPNHFHGILVIRPNVGATFMVAQERAGMNPAPTRTESDGRPTVGEVIGAFKSLTTHAYIDGVKTRAWGPFDRQLWRRNCYERVIRNDDDWNRMNLYVECNPRNWEDDEENLNHFRES